MTIRPATQDDFKSIKKVLNSQKEWMPSVLNYNLNDGINTSSLFVYEKKDEILGIIRWLPRQDGTNTIHELCVKKGIQGKGIGKQLLNVVPGDIQLKTTFDNKQVISFYESQGFKNEGTQKGKNKDLVILKRKSNYFCVNLLNILDEKVIEKFIINNLDEKLLKPYWKKKENRINTSGHCYHASEAMYYLTGGKSNWIPQVGKDDNNDTHWWLKGRFNNEIRDVTKTQYFHLKKIPPYHKGKGTGFQQQSFASIELIYNTLIDLNENYSHNLIKQSIKKIEPLYLKTKNKKSPKI